MHPLLHRAGCIVPCIIVHRISQLSPHVLIQSMRTSFCIYRLMSCQNINYNYQIWATGARSGPLGVILSTVSSHSPALLSLIIPVFRGRNQRFIKKCTLRWTIAGYRPQYEVSSKVSHNNALASNSSCCTAAWFTMRSKGFGGAAPNKQKPPASIMDSQKPCLQQCYFVWKTVENVVPSTTLLSTWIEPLCI